jgi:tetratricopeptide (TPR) repeat protein
MTDSGRTAPAVRLARSARRARVSGVSRFTAATVISAVVATLSVSRNAAWAADAWTEIKAPHVTVMANGGTRDARTLAWQLEQIRAVLVKILPWAQVNLDRPLHVLAVNSEPRMRALLPSYWQERRDAKPVSVWVSGPDRHYLAIRSDEKAEDRTYINPHVNAYFSYVSLVIQNSRQAAMPLWFTRGLAGVLSNTIVRESEVLVGPPIPWHLRELRERPRLRLTALVGATSESPEARGDRMPQYDAQAWAFVHFLLFGDEGARAVKLNQFFTLVNSGSEHAAAHAEAFGPIDQLESHFVRYLGQEIFTFGKMPIDESVRREKFAERILPAGDASSILALFHVAMRQAPEARAAIAEARKAGGTVGDSHFAEALLLRSEGNEDAVRPLLERASAAGSTAAYAYYELARLLWRPDSDSDSLVTMEKLLRRAAELNPQWSWTFALLASVRAQLDQDDALDFAVRAIRLAPAESSHRLTAGLVLLRAGRHAEALAAVEAAIKLAETDDDTRRARQLQNAIEKSKPKP